MIDSGMEKSGQTPLSKFWHSARFWAPRNEELVRSKRKISPIIGTGMGRSLAEITMESATLGLLLNSRTKACLFGVSCISIPGMNHGRDNKRVIEERRKLVHNSFDHHFMLVVSRKSAQSATFRSVASCRDNLHRASEDSFEQVDGTGASLSVAGV